MDSARMVSIVVPTYNRASELSGVIRSILEQSHTLFEIIVVDDASTDDTERVVHGFGDPRITYLRHSERRNGAAARNTGTQHAAGDFVAFLDSDDEWLPDHLSRKLAILQDTGADGIFGSFYLEWMLTTVEMRCSPRPTGMSMAEYILSPYPGDARTSTFVFRREALQEVMFDASLEKHQDWDLAIRFAEAFKLVCDPESTVVIHPDAEGRMSYHMKHGATAEFFTRYQSDLTAKTLASAYTRLASRTLESEGRNGYFGEYLRRARQHWLSAGLRDKATIVALSVPGVDRTFLRAGHKYVKMRRRMRPSESQKLTLIRREGNSHHDPAE